MPLGRFAKRSGPAQLVLGRNYYLTTGCPHPSRMSMAIDTRIIPQRLQVIYELRESIVTDASAEIGFVRCLVSETHFC